MAEAAAGRDRFSYTAGWGVLHAEERMFPVDVSDWPVKIGPERQLFLDDYLIARREGLLPEAKS